MKTINVATAKTAELLAFYNANADKPVSKFTNLETARRRVTALIEALEISGKAHEAAKAAKAAARLAQSAAKDASHLATAVDKTVSVKTPGSETTKDATPAPAASTPAIPKPEKGAKTKAEPEKPAPAAKPEKPKAEAQTVAQARRSNAAGIAASWNDPDVREARLYRQGVIVMLNGKSLGEFNSTHAAFEAIGLPMSKVIRFRMKLKDAKKLTFTHAGKDYEFSIL